MPERWYRSQSNRVIGGVCGGIAEKVGVDATIVRLVWVLLTFASHGALALVYFVLLFVLPEAPEEPGQPAGDAARSSSPGAARSQASSDGRRGTLAAGAVLVVLGGYFLVRQYLPSIDLTAGWPFIAVGLGLVLIVAALRPGGRSG